ncbi:hypothetical protein HBI24_223210 [Parastagonospora nodorum]|nr:hypothetical protein HBI10_221700 [Parastagonospora nodorum]KAH4009671.1 hypothetical protein HBI13_217770 [Parastagonospora nodorum]KAH4043552.1 hypothetical protein HBH49_231880 [Parastagonospora nodorum]KAH4089094.1 hypothetical protein HBH46_193290 [Parastagonospora nodorum]KAH5003590.1 hypothetical protein HBI74_233090 [Parastagonospora nodorum]
MLNPLLPLSIHALNSTPSSERILQLSEPFSEDTHPRISHFTLSPPPHPRLSTSTDSIRKVLPTTRAVADSELGADGVVHTQNDPTTGKPRSTCPTIICIFDCDECGGGKDVRSEKIINGIPNASCIGSANGLWEDCACYHGPPQNSAP